MIFLDRQASRKEYTIVVEVLLPGLGSALIINHLFRFLLDLFPDHRKSPNQAKERFPESGVKRNLNYKKNILLPAVKVRYESK